MNAEEARLRAYQANTDASDSQYADIKKTIERYAGGGYYSFYYSSNLKDDVKKKLTEEGFKVGRTSTGRNEYSTEISWN